MNRLTNNNGIPNKCVGCAETSNCFGNMSCPEICKALEKLKHYEDLEEQGKLIELPCETVWFIVDKRTQYATVMSKSIKDLCLEEIKKIDLDGRYFSTKEKAENALRELREMGE